VVERALEVDRAVVDEHVDPDLPAARHLVVRAVQLVVREAHAVEPELGVAVGVGRPVAGDVDEVAGGLPAADGVDRARVRLGAEHVALGMGLDDADVDLLGAQGADAPADLLLVREVDAEAPLGGGGELVPVVVERGVDVDGDPQGPIR
jgi:hypothetical protein